MANVKLSPEILAEIISLAQRGIVQPSKQARAVGITPDTLNNWLFKSNSGDPDFLMEFSGETMQFAKAYTLAKRFAMMELRGQVETECIFGTTELSYKDGQVVWAYDPKAAALPEDLRELCGYRKDALLEINGELQPVIVRKQAPFGKQIRILEAAFKDMRPSSVSEVQVSGQVAVGVAYTPKQSFSGPPPAIPPAPVPPQLEILGDVDQPFEDAETDADAEGLTEPTVPPISITLSPQIVIEDDFVPGPAPEPPAPPEQVIREENPAEYTPQPSLAFSAPPQRQPRNALERDLFEKLRARAK